MQCAVTTAWVEACAALMTACTLRRVTVILAVVGQSVAMVYRLYCQARVDVFFIDWEKPRRTLSKDGERVPQSIHRSAPHLAGLSLERACARELLGVVAVLSRAVCGACAGNREEDAPVSAWRTLLVANEFAELQTLRVTHLGFTWLMMVRACAWPWPRAA